MLNAEKAIGVYTLIICEKPDAASRVSEALSDGEAQSRMVHGVQVFRFSSGSEEFVVCSAQGHVYAVSDPFDERSVYPVFDADWFSSDLVDRGSANAGRRIAVVKEFAQGANRFINACDHDVEGETIGFNVLRYACAGKEVDALRAKFSTLTKEDLVEAFRDAKQQPGQGLARAGRARHLIDFMWGVNLSRALSQSALRSGHRYRTVSIGRVQGPTLNFLVEREQEIREFVPVPFWKVTGVFDREGQRLIAGYSRERVETKSVADQVKSDCGGKAGVVASVSRSLAKVQPNYPFNIGDLQKEAYRVFGLSPARTLQIAERLYLDALISYPRTGSQRLPPSINYGAIVRGLERLSEYTAMAGEIGRRPLHPVQGTKTDLAHPAIHPTGERPRRRLNSSETSVFDLVVRRFMAAFGNPAIRESVSVVISVGRHRFKLRGWRTLNLGWMGYYGRYSWAREVEIPRVSEGQVLDVKEVKVEEHSESKPLRFNQSSLLEKMEKEKIGTKATRADIISTLVSRGYVTGERMTVNDLGLSVIETMKRYAPSIVTTELTREIEGRLQSIESGDLDDKELIRETIRSITTQLLELNSNEEAVGRDLDSALSAVFSTPGELGACPVCKTGNLRMVRSKTTRKRFVGCSNYGKGCRASSPLPQRGSIKVTSKVCHRCSWPIVYVIGGRSPWRLCINMDCPGKGDKKHEVPPV